jgi:hypothetical protein
LLLARAVGSLGSHAVWTGLACAAWFAMFGARRPWLTRLRFFLVFGTVVCLHAQWDASVGGDAYLLIGLAGVTLLAGTTAWLHRRTRLPAVDGARPSHIGGKQP